jgi:hypothetical protein
MQVRHEVAAFANIQGGVSVFATQAGAASWR